MKRIKTCKFEPGQIVHHQYYGYKGVIYDVDNCCEAEDAWYYQNRTMPDRNQPWYHVLVDGADHTTYVAEENLERARISRLCLMKDTRESLLLIDCGRITSRGFRSVSSLIKRSSAISRTQNSPVLSSR